MIKAITGSNYGDEGKGKLTDLLASQADIVVRFQGGANAGHTIVNDYGKFVLHLLPSGVFYEHTVNLIASGVAFDADKFFEELAMLEERGVKTPHVLISSRAQLLLPIHRLQDQLEEKRLGEHSFGSTQSGIAPFYADKFAKKNIRIADLYADNLAEKAAFFCRDKNIYFKAFYGVEEALTVETLMAYLIELQTRLKPYLCDMPYYMQDAMKQNKNILLEGQLGALRDVENGIYPYVTSSSPIAGFGSVSAGIPPYKIKTIVSVVKAYSTCVGAAPFVGELLGEDGNELRRRGGEFGATTGRPRRIAWFDCVSARYGCMLQGTTEIALTLMDVLGYREKIPVCVGYKIDGKVTDRFPETHMLYKAEPVYEYLEGWNCDIAAITEYEQLPEAAKTYVDFLEEQLGIPITMVSNGPKRNQILYRKSKLENKE